VENNGEKVTFVGTEARSSAVWVNVLTTRQQWPYFKILEFSVEF